MPLLGHIRNDELPAVLLVGGLGKRLRPVVQQTPKPLAALGRSCFLALLLEQLRHQHVRRIVLCTGYLGEQIRNQFGNGAGWNIEIQYSHEDQPLGTGGALKFAEGLLGGSSEFVVMNGDSFIDMDLRAFLRFHRTHGGIASLAVRRATNASRYGQVIIEGEAKVVGFVEKSGDQVSGLVNAGVYIFNRDVFQHMTSGPSSLERDVFPRLTSYGIHAMEQRGAFIDIGTPEDYLRARQMCEGLYKAALNPHHAI